MSTIKEVNKLVDDICTNYGKLTFEGSDDFFFNRFHDIMLIQMECAIEAANDFEHLIKQGHTEDAEAIVGQLKDTKEYCRAIIKAQDSMNAILSKAPSPVFG